MTQILIIHGTQLGDRRFTRGEARRECSASPAPWENALINAKARGSTFGICWRSWVGRSEP